jgi:hypothetical protein
MLIERPVEMETGNYLLYHLLYRLPSCPAVILSGALGGEFFPVFNVGVWALIYVKLYKSLPVPD